MNKVARSALGDALAERVKSLARVNQRLQAVDDSSDHVIEEPDPKVVLQRALAALSNDERYELALRILAGERVTSSYELAKAGLVVWDPGSDSVRPTALLVELMQIFEAAMGEARTEL